MKVNGWLVKPLSPEEEQALFDTNTRLQIENRNRRDGGHQYAVALEQEEVPNLTKGRRYAR